RLISMMSKNSIVPFLKDYLIKFLTRPFLLDTNEHENETGYPDLPQTCHIVSAGLQPYIKQTARL
ncbi:MAG: hypothetical protein KIC78_01705, partial [Prevotella sp.]|uniref:hypothetical protein n=1 Tax=Prevotella sp. TaxID=59823 RepID=UPI00257D520E